MTKVVNLYTLSPGWENDPEYVYIGRAGRGQTGEFGNPFLLGKDGTREEVLALYREWFHSRVVYDKNFRRRVIEKLDGKILVCFCKPLPCHGDIIIEFLGG